MMSRPSEQRPARIEAEAHTVAERLVTKHKERDGLREISKSACHDSYDALN
jgi:hypothetical protein